MAGDLSLWVAALWCGGYHIFSGVGEDDGVVCLLDWEEDNP